MSVSSRQYASAVSNRVTPASSAARSTATAASSSRLASVDSRMQPIATGRDAGDGHTGRVYAGEPGDRLLRAAAALDLTPAFDVDLNLIGGRAHPAADAARTGRDSDTAADVHAFVELALLHQPGEFDHRALVRLDLGEQRLRAAHPQVHPFTNLEIARLLERSRTGREDVTLGAAGDRDPHRILRHRLLFLARESYRQRSGDRNGSGKSRHRIHSTHSARGCAGACALHTHRRSRAADDGTPPGLSRQS